MVSGRLDGGSNYHFIETVRNFVHKNQKHYFAQKKQHNLLSLAKRNKNNYCYKQKSQ